MCLRAGRRVKALTGPMWWSEKVGVILSVDSDQYIYEIEFPFCDGAAIVELTDAEFVPMLAANAEETRTFASPDVPTQETLRQVQHLLHEFVVHHGRREDEEVLLRFASVI